MLGRFKMDTTNSCLREDVLECIEEFYRVLELSVADALPSSISGYQEFKIHINENQIPLWEIMEKEISSKILNWPEWYAILHLEQQDPKNNSTVVRYKDSQEIVASIPIKFQDFNERFQNTLLEIREIAVEKIRQAIICSLIRFSENPGYKKACLDFQSYLIPIEELTHKEECLPFFDIWNPLRMGEEILIPEILERITEEIKSVESICYPYNADKTCQWNFSLIIRLQVELIQTIRDRVSRLIAVAENHFKDFFINEVLRRELLPIIRIHLNDSQFITSILKKEFK